MATKETTRAALEVGRLRCTSGSGLTYTAAAADSGAARAVNDSHEHHDSENKE
jgi:hypothetical protein